MAALQLAGIDLVLDVRAVPQSRKRGFSRGPLNEFLQAAGIAYRSEPRFGTPTSVRRAYQRSADREAFAAAYRRHLEGQEDLLSAYVDELSAPRNVCLLCLEADPADCHRSLLAEALAGRLGVETHHL